MFRTRKDRDTFRQWVMGTVADLVGIVGVELEDRGQRLQRWAGQVSYRHRVLPHQ